MELKAGYKTTDIGVIPEDWNPETYGQLFQFLTTSSYSRDELKSEGEIAYIHYGDIHTKFHQFIDLSSSIGSYVSLEQGKKYPFIKEGDLIMADASEDYSGIGKSVEVKNLGTTKAISGLHTFLLRDKDNSFENGFKAFIHEIPPVKKSLDRLATGLKVYGISKNNLKKILIPLPPKTQQKAIAQALSDIDSLINNLDKLIAKKKAIKQGAMQQLLKSPSQGGKRLPGFEGEWIPIRLGEYCTITSGESPSKFVLQNSGIPYFKVEQLNNGLKYANKTPYFIDHPSPVKSNSIVFPKRGASILQNKIRIFTQDSFLDTNLMALTPDADLDVEYLFYSLTYFGLASLADTTSIPQINNKHINPLQMLIPSTEEQKAIARILSDIDVEIDQLEIKRSKLTNIKKGMVQELLTGKTRLV